MKLDHAVKYFGNQRKMAESLGITESAVSRWKERGGIVPIRLALKVSKLSEGEVDLRLIDYRD